jgi:hypothetical protein
VTGPFLTFFPQFCREPVNDSAWYTGFTDWDLIRQVPHPFRDRFTPAAGYYDLANGGDIARQLEAVGRSAWPAMALYQYFFDGRFLLDCVERHIINTRAPVPPFFTIWANETWSKRYIGKPRQIIIRQGHSIEPACVKAHVERLAALFRHPSYAREKGRPIFVIYAPFDIPRVTEFVQAYRRAFAEAGVDPLIGFCVSYVDPEFDARAFDFCVEFQPRLFFNEITARHRRQTMKIVLLLRQRAMWAFDAVTGTLDRVRRRRSRPTLSFDYQEYLELVEQDYFGRTLEHVYQVPVHRAAFFSWNNFPRYRGSAAQVLHRQGDYEAFSRICERLRARQRWFLVNSWNEWSEGAALEPGVVPVEAFDSIDPELQGAVRA